MLTHILDPKPCGQKDLEVDIDRLGQFIQEHFPAEAASADMENPRDVLRLAKDLLRRLWRWEN